MSLQEVIERIRGLGEPPNEEAVILQIVLPILRELGWDSADPSRVAPQYTVGQGKGAGRVDLALLMPRRGPVALIEAKAPNVRLEDHVEQVLRYAFYAGVNICVLTSGLKWWLYLSREDGPPSERRFADLDVEADGLEQLVDDFDTYLGYEALTARRAERHARQVLAAHLDSERLSSELPRIWVAMLNEPPQRLLDLIEQRVFNSIRLRPSHEQMTAFLQSHAVIMEQASKALSSSSAGANRGQSKSKRSKPKSSSSTLPLTNGTISERPDQKPPSPEDIIKATATVLGISAEAFIAKRKDQRTAYARHIAMFLVREHRGYSYAEIGKSFGGRDHTTVLHGCRKIEAELAGDPSAGIKPDAETVQLIADIRRRLSL